jgi:predicted ATPase
MLTKLRLKNFKNFKDAELHLGGFTVLLGTNAAGKSNIRDAMRFLNGIGRGYTLAEIIGGKFAEDGSPEWNGIRGGLGEIAFRQEPIFELEIAFTVIKPMEILKGKYQITCEVEPSGSRVAEEILTYEGYEEPIFEVKPLLRNSQKLDGQELLVKLYSYPGSETQKSSVIMSDRSFLSQCIGPNFNDEVLESPLVHHLILVAAQVFVGMRFLDLQPEAMRQSSIPGQTRLSNRGENLSAVIQSISSNPQLKANFLTWLQSLTPMDAQDLRFLPDVTGKVLLQLMEASGHLTSAISASDGTLKFMGFLAAYLSAAPARLLFLEELENGIHPTRLHLLLQLIEQQAQQGKVQTIATTHSPQLLRLLSEDSLKNASLIYRLDDRPDAQIQRLVDIPHFQDVLDGSDLGELLESGWLETTMSFQRDEVAIG